VSVPRRYRIALRAFPRGARKRHAGQLLDVLAQSDRDRGSASWHEALALLWAGCMLRLHLVLWVLTAARLARLAAALTVLAAASPASLWSVRGPVAGERGYALLDGPTPLARWALLTAAAFALAATSRGVRRDRIAVVGVAALGAGTTFALAMALRDPIPGLSVDELGAACLRGAGFAAVVVLGALLLARLPGFARLRAGVGAVVIAGVVALSGAVHADPPSRLGTLTLWQLRPIGVIAELVVVLGVATMLAHHADRRLRPQATA
jgi:hypothetical protein